MEYVDKLLKDAIASMPDRVVVVNGEPSVMRVVPKVRGVLEAADKTIGELRAHLSEIRTIVNGSLDAESKIEAIRLVVGGGE